LPGKFLLPNILRFSIISFAGGSIGACFEICFSLAEIFGRKIMDDLIDCKKQSHDTNTENFFKSGEGYTLNNRRSHTGDVKKIFYKYK
jgi:hypothetical protein